jgi:hypothetical protein
MAGQLNEDVFQGRLTEGHRLNYRGTGFYDIAHERMAMGDFDAHTAVDNDRLGAEPLADLALQPHRVWRLHYDHIPTYSLLQFIWRPYRYQASLVQDADTITVFGFLQDMRGQQDTDTFLVTQMFQIGHKIEAGAWIEASAGLIE